jgi:phosphatidylglycerophosphate synthase
MKLPQDKLLSLKLTGYLYKGQDVSVLSTIFDKLNYVLLPYVPKFVAPNLLTIIGFCFTILAFTFAYCGLYIPFFVMVIMYMIFDNLDGSHARQIGQSSPTGEVLDHSLDSISNTLITISLCTLGNIELPSAFILTLCMNIVFMLSHIKSYYNGILIIDKVGPVELFVIAFMVLYYSSSNKYNLNNIFVYNYTLCVYYILCGIFTYITYNPKCLQIDNTHIITQKYTKVDNIKKLKLLSLPMALMPVLFNFIDYNTNIMSVIYYSHVYSLLTTDIILSKILKKDFNNTLILLICFLLFCLDIPIVIFITFCVYYTYVINELGYYFSTPLIFVKCEKLNKEEIV